MIESYTAQGQLNRRVLGLTFVDLAEMDGGSDTDVFTKEEHLVLDYSRPAGQEWTYRGYTVNPFKYPDDPRLHLSPTHDWVRRIDGHQFLFVTDMTGEFLYVDRFNEQTDSETAIPCALFSRHRANRHNNYPPHQPDKGEWIWLDRNANGSLDEDECLGLRQTKNRLKQSRLHDAAGWRESARRTS